jgi:predicted nucleotidyltransferase
MDKREATAIAKQYAQAVAQDMNPDKIVLYGSTVNGMRRDDSDIDVAVIFDKFEGDWLKTSVRLSILRTDIGYEIEPLLCVTSEDRSGFVEEILRTGEVLFERS